MDYLSNTINTRTEKVTIVIINYNGAADTIECLQSLEKINYKNVEIVVIDNGSTDNSVDVLKKHKNNFRLLTSETNLGFAGGNNIGIKYALRNGADFVLLLNNDTLVNPDFVDHLLATARTAESIGIVGGKIF